MSTEILVFFPRQLRCTGDLRIAIRVPGVDRRWAELTKKERSSDHRWRDSVGSVCPVFALINHFEAPSTNDCIHLLIVKRMSRHTCIAAYICVYIY